MLTFSSHHLKFKVDPLKELQKKIFLEQQEKEKALLIAKMKENNKAAKQFFMASKNVLPSIKEAKIAAAEKLKQRYFDKIIGNKTPNDDENTYFKDPSPLKNL